MTAWTTRPPRTSPGREARGAARRASWRGSTRCTRPEPCTPSRPSKRDYIGGYGDAPTLLVQGPPGTGKSYATAFALFARLQGAMAADRALPRLRLLQDPRGDRRAAAERPARAARLLRGSRGAPGDLRRLLRRAPARSAALPRAPARRDAGRRGRARRANERAQGGPRAVDADPGGAVVRRRRRRRAGSTASQGSLARRPLRPRPLRLPGARRSLADEPARGDDGGAARSSRRQLIVVGDHRQMPPIVKHDWEHEPRRTFQEFRAYESLFLRSWRSSRR